MQKLIQAYKTTNQVIFVGIYNDLNLIGKILIFPLFLLNYPLFFFVILLMKD